MRKSSRTPMVVPYGADQTVYLVIDRLGQSGSVYRETEVEQTDLETTIADLMSGQFNDPMRVVAFNPEHIQDFVANYTGPARQLALRLV
jgi:hypothetical protein